jgi:hypothetical protein
VLIEIEFFDPERQEVRFRTPAGAVVTGGWGEWYPPDIGTRGPELSVGPTCVWETDVMYAQADEPDAIVQDEDGYLLVGQVEGPIPVHDRRDGIFYLRIFGSLVMLDADHVPPDVAGRRVCVRQQTLTVF